MRKRIPLFISALLLGASLSGCVHTKTPYSGEWELSGYYPKTQEATRGIEFISIDKNQIGLVESAGSDKESRITVTNLYDSRSEAGVTTLNLPLNAAASGVTQLKDGTLLVGTKDTKTFYKVKYDTGQLIIKESIQNKFNVSGICAHEENLVVSHGNNELTVHDGKNFEKKYTLKLSLKGKSLEKLGELECMPEHNAVLTSDGSLQKVHMVDLKTGHLLTTWDFTELVESEEKEGAIPDPENNYLNGIALSPWNENEIVITGKNWKKHYIVSIS